jgi:hypothetical protein
MNRLDSTRKTQTESTRPADKKFVTSRQELILTFAMLLYTASFLMVAAVGPGEWRGAGLAFTAFILPITNFRHAFSAPFGTIFYNRPFEYIALLITGWINLVFVGTLFIGKRLNQQAIAGLLKIGVLLMIPFSWIVMSYEDMYPRGPHRQDLRNGSRAVCRWNRPFSEGDSDRLVSPRCSLRLRRRSIPQWSLIRSLSGIDLCQVAEEFFRPESPRERTQIDRHERPLNRHFLRDVFYELQQERDTAGQAGDRENAKHEDR